MQAFGAKSPYKHDPGPAVRSEQDNDGGKGGSMLA
jgi:hypothetical protein